MSPGPGQETTLRVNGVTHRLQVRPHTTLLQLLQDHLGLNGPKRGCDSGGCGCCTVLLDGRPVYSCMVFALGTEGQEVTTVEGLGSRDRLDPVQEAFVEVGAIQCGYCTPGIIMVAKWFLERDRKTAPEEPEIRETLAGNLCRCTGYAKILQAVRLAAGRLEP